MVSNLMLTFPRALCGLVETTMLGLKIYVIVLHIKIILKIV